MLILSATKETKATLQKKRNLFGLGVTSLIAACSGADGAGAGAGGDGNNNIEPSETGNSVTLPFEAKGITDSDSQLTTSLYGSDYQFTIAITKGEGTPKNLTFTDGNNPEHGLISKAEIHKLTATADQYDLVISSGNIDTVARYTNDQGDEVDNPEFQKGRIFIFWNAKGIKDETIGRSVDPATNLNKYLEVKGAYRDDTIGIDPPEFFQINDTKNSYDMVFRSVWADKVDMEEENQGGVFILWDVTGYAGPTTVIDLGEVTASGSLAIYGATTNDYIGTHAPEFVQIGGATDQKYDMIIRSNKVDKDDGSTTTTNAGAIYILWDVADYQKDAAGKIAKKVIDLGAAADNSAGNYATSGLLTIYGKVAGAELGSNDNNILYGYDANGNKDFIDINNDQHKDLIFQDADNTYILFGDKIAEVVGGKVTSKTIDLTTVKDIDTNAAGYFNYIFRADGVSDDTALITSDKTDDTIGYRFATADRQNHKTADDVLKGNNLPDFTNLSSDADADLGVWDIA